jgi:hypothetical protein
VVILFYSSPRSAPMNENIKKKESESLEANANLIKIKINLFSSLFSHLPYETVLNEIQFTT